VVFGLTVNQLGLLPNGKHNWKNLKKKSLLGHKELTGAQNKNN